MAEEKPKKYLDIEISYIFEGQNEIDNMIKAVNTFIEQHKDGLSRVNFNILGYSYY